MISIKSMEGLPAEAEIDVGCCRTTRRRLEIESSIRRRDRGRIIREWAPHHQDGIFGTDRDATRRRAAIEELYTDDCALYAPPGIFVGHDALDKFAGDLRATHPHFSYTPHGAPQALHNAGRLAWGSGPRGEAPDYTAVDVVIVRDDKIAALYVFLDSLPS